MEKIERLITTLSSINNKILDDNNIAEQSNGINELNNLIKDKEIENIIKEKQLTLIENCIEKNNKRIKEISSPLLEELERQKNEYEKENKKIEILINTERLNIQEIFNISVENNFVGIFRYIMKNYRQEIDINARVDNFNKPLIFVACEKEEYEIFKSLLSDAEIDIDNKCIEYSSDIFHKAYSKKNLDYMKLILEKAKKQNKKININYYNGDMLRKACLSVNVKLVEYLLSLDDIKIDLKDFDGNSIFISACKNEKKDCECVKLLYNKYIERNMELDINEENNQNRTAIFYACANGNIDLVKYLFSITNIDNIKNFDFLSGVCLSGNIELVKLLYHRFGDKINDSIITKAFSYAINSKNIGLVEYLMNNIPNIENRIDFNSEIFNDYLIDSFLEDNFEMIKLLHNKYGTKININSTDSLGNSIFYYACQLGNLKIVDFLISKQWKENVDINIINEYGKTPFIAACKKGRFDIAKMLFDRSDFDREKNNISTKIVVREDKFTNTVYNINNFDKTKPLYQIKCSSFNTYPKMITYFIGGKTFTATIDEKLNIKFNFEGLEGITSEYFEKEVNKILNSFENVNSFDTYVSWLPLALIEFKKQERQKNQNIVISDEIEFFDFHFCMDKIKGIIDNNLKNNEDKIVICDFGFSFEELSEDINDVKDEQFKKKHQNVGHAIPLVIFNSKDVDGNPQTKILAFNTGFKSKKAFKKFKQKLGNDIEIIKIDKDLYQKYGSCNLSPKPMIEALFSSFINELGEGESLVDKLEQYSKDMVIANKLAELKNKIFKKNKKNKILEDINL